MEDYILLFGASLESTNRGLNALGIGAIKVLNSSYGTRKFIIIALSPVEHVSKHLLFVNEIEVTVEIYYFSKYKTLQSIFEFYKFKLFGKKTSSLMSQIILNSNKVFVLNGGDSFSDIYGLKIILKHFLDSYVVLLSGKELVFLPQTIGPFNTLIGRILAKYILQKVTKIYLRDNCGAKYLHEMGVPYYNKLDVAVCMEPKKVSYLIERNTIGINVNGLLFHESYGNIIGKCSSYKALISRIIDVLCEKGFHVLLVPHTYNYNAANPEDDLSAINAIVKEKRQNNLKFVNEDYDAQQLKFIISQLDCFIGSRMHSCIAALTTSVPTIGLSYSPKFIGTFELFNQSDCVVDIFNLKDNEIDSVISRVVDIIGRRAIIRDSLNSLNSKMETLILE